MHREGGEREGGREGGEEREREKERPGSVAPHLGARRSGFDVRDGSVGGNQCPALGDVIVSQQRLRRDLHVVDIPHVLPCISEAKPHGLNQAVGAGGIVIRHAANS